LLTDDWGYYLELFDWIRFRITIHFLKRLPIYLKKIYEMWVSSSYVYGNSGTIHILTEYSSSIFYYSIKTAKNLHLRDWGENTMKRVKYLWHACRLIFNYSDIVIYLVLLLNTYVIFYNLWCFIIFQNQYTIASLYIYYVLL